jgi:hypothetical protein
VSDPALVTKTVATALGLPDVHILNGHFFVHGKYVAWLRMCPKSALPRLGTLWCQRRAEAATARPEPPALVKHL